MFAVYATVRVEDLKHDNRRLEPVTVEWEFIFDQKGNIDAS